MEALIFWGIVAFLIYFFGIRKIFNKKNMKEKFAALPEHGPMKVNITTEDVPPGRFNSKRYKCMMRWEVIISQEDWKAIAQMGFMEHIILTAPAPSGDMNDPANVWHWRVKQLKEKGVAEFHNVIQMQEAKDKFIENLQNLRSQIEARKHEDRSEQIEI